MSLPAPSPWRTSSTNALPLLASLGPARRRLTPRLFASRLSGISAGAHVALTFDDGPDPGSTPQFLDLLAEFGVHATFFVLGRHLGDGALLRDTVSRGHEIGVHGWDHVPAPAQEPFRLRRRLADTRQRVEDLTQAPVRWYRPPYGLLTRTTLAAATGAGLDVVLWSAWGRDWTRTATATSVLSTVLSQLTPGGTVLLHDSDRTSAPGSWRGSLAATRLLLERWRAVDQDVGSLAEHGIPPLVDEP
jgi:peptidoglycan/xylan/chitin deacetylase (PgdA/CDA1 family)